MREDRMKGYQKKNATTIYYGNDFDLSNTCINGYRASHDRLAVEFAKCHKTRYSLKFATIAKQDLKKVAYNAAKNASNAQQIENKGIAIVTR